MTRSEYLRDLAERLMHVPGPHTDQSDCDQLSIMARELSVEGAGNAPSPFSEPSDTDLDDLLG